MGAPQENDSCGDSGDGDGDDSDREHPLLKKEFKNHIKQEEVFLAPSELRERHERDMRVT